MQVYMYFCLFCFAFLTLLPYFGERRFCVFITISSRECSEALLSGVPPEANAELQNRENSWAAGSLQRSPEP